MLRRFENKIALVTGGAGGIGLGITRRFSAEGAAVVIADINGAAGLTARGDGGSIVNILAIQIVLQVEHREEVSR